MSGRDGRKMWCSDGHRNANRWRTGPAVAIATVPIATVSIATVPIAEVPIAEVPIATAPRPRCSVRRLADVSFVADPRQRTLQTIALKATSDQPLRGWGPRHRGLGSACWPFWFWRWSSAVLNTARTTSLCGPNAPMRAELRSLVCQPLQPPVPGSLLGLCEAVDDARHEPSSPADAMPLSWLGPRPDSCPEPASIIPGEKTRLTPRQGEIRSQKGLGLASALTSSHPDLRDRLQRWLSDQISTPISMHVSRVDCACTCSAAKSLIC